MIFHQFLFSQKEKTKKSFHPFASSSSMLGKLSHQYNRFQTKKKSNRKNFCGWMNEIPYGREEEQEEQDSRVSEWEKWKN